jgi:hypothetical protein
MSDETRPQPDPKAGVLVYGWSTAIRPVGYEHPEVRKSTEDLCHLVLKSKTGLDHVWGEWRFVPESDCEDETGEIRTLPALWVYTCEAPGPEGLTS